LAEAFVWLIESLTLAPAAGFGAAKHLVQQRMKRAGMRWSELDARAVLHLRCALLNHDLLKQAA
jgi:hypothetical protein